MQQQEDRRPASISNRNLPMTDGSPEETPDRSDNERTNERVLSQTHNADAPGKSAGAPRSKQGKLKRSWLERGDA